MPLITDASQVRELYDEAREYGFMIPGLGAENCDTVECHLTAAAKVAAELGVEDIPLCIAFTGHYPPRSQLRKYTSLGSCLEGLLKARDDLRRLLRRDGPFGRLRVHAHLDHAQPEMDQELFEAGRGFLGSVMYDASAWPLEENSRMTRAFVERWRGEYLIEGAVDELPESGSSRTLEDDMTRPEDAALFLEETGVDLVVVNVGTEHRATAEEARYHADRARAIGALTGPRLVLHGSSSLGDTPLSAIRDDGFVRFNQWTAFERAGGQAIAEDTVRNIAAVLPRDLVEELAREGWLGPACLSDSRRPSLAHLTHDHRRDAAWAPAVVELVCRVLRECRYEGLAAR